MYNINSMHVFILFLKNLHDFMNYKMHILIFLMQAIFLYINSCIWKKKKNNIHLLISIFNNILIGLVNYYFKYFTSLQYTIINIILIIISIVNVSIGFYRNFIKKSIK